MSLWVSIAALRQAQDDNSFDRLRMTIDKRACHSELVEEGMRFKITIEGTG